MTAVENKRVLIVEDVEEMLELMAVLVSEIPGFEVSGKAKNCWEARLELGRRKPDLVLLDEVLPGESGLDLLPEIASLGVPVLLMTGMEEARHELPAGVSGRFSKPSWDTMESQREGIAQALKTALSG
jgi:response regulator of citrate/malate metabolism